MIDGESANPLFLAPEKDAGRKCKDVKDPLLDGFLMLCRICQRPVDHTEVIAGLSLKGGHLTLPLLHRAAARVGLSIQIHRKGIREIEANFLPALLILKDGSTAALISATGKRATIILPEIEWREISLPIWELTSIYSGVVVFVVPSASNNKLFSKAK